MIKARHTLIYAALLVALVGYYSYFEVMKPHQKQQAEQVARKVFQFPIDKVNGLELSARGKTPVRMVKETDWQIKEPVKAEVDATVLTGMLNALETLQRDRKVVENSQDLKVYGLQDPALTLRFKLGDTWHELLIGDLNPVGDSYYAKTGDQPLVFLMARGNWSIFYKETKDLRRRQLFGFEPQAVTALDVAWQGGEHFTVVKDATGVWRSPEQADRTIKKSKVDEVLDQIHWLRARDFLADNTSDLKPWGLDSPRVTVKLQLKEGQDAILQLGSEEKKKLQVAALASQLGAVVGVEGEILQKLPKDLHSLEDRSLLTFKTDQVRQVFWKSGGHQGILIHADGTKWLWKVDAGKEQELTQSWQIQSLLWELGDAEYEHRIEPAEAPAMGSHGYLEFWSSTAKLGAVSWEDPASAKEGTVLMWLMPDGDAAPLAVRSKSEVVQKMDEKLTELAQSQPH